MGFLKSVKFSAEPAGQAGLPPSHPPRAGAEGAGSTTLPPSHPPIGDMQAAAAGLPPSHPPIGTAADQTTAGQPASLLPSPDWRRAWRGASARRQVSMEGAGRLAGAASRHDADGQVRGRGRGGNQSRGFRGTMPGEGGGLLGNVNRWRKQIGLGPI